MGMKLMKYYDFIAKTQHGIVGKAKLAQMTKIPSTIAASQPDSHENVEKFRKAVEAITGKPAPVL